MSFVKVGDRIINLAMVVLVRRIDTPHKRSVAVGLAGHAEPCLFQGEEADKLWRALCDMATPVDVLANRRQVLERGEG